MAMKFNAKNLKIRRGQKRKINIYFNLNNAAKLQWIL